MYTLGINAAFHDPAAALVQDGQVLAAAEEERFTHIKHGKRPVPFSAYELPFHAIDYCLAEAGIVLDDVDRIAYSFDPYVRLNSHKGSVTLPLEPSALPMPAEWENPWDPLFLAHIVNAPRHLLGGVPHHLEKRLSSLRGDHLPRWHFVDHHLCHAASAFLCSPYDEAAVFTIDGRGEKATTTYGVGEGSELTVLESVWMPHSLGLLYEQVTDHLGFLHSSDEYKVMALASYGSPRYLPDFRRAITVGENGQYRIDARDLWAAIGTRRRTGEPLEQRHLDIARSLQTALEEVALRLVDWLHERTGKDNLVMAGGVALNCVLNSRIGNDGPFTHMWVQPAAGDSGTALGAALVVDSQMRGAAAKSFHMDNCYLGPQFSDSEIESLLKANNISARRLSNVAEETASILTRNLIVGWFQGRMEFGPRALGARSIIASPCSADMQQKLNWIKDREDFRPVAPVVLEEETHKWFDTDGPSPFMLFVIGVRPECAARIPAVCHVDGTARIQTINREQNPLYYDVVAAFRSMTGVPVLVNTSFNTRSRPIVCTPSDALECFWTSPLDALVLGSFLLVKQPECWS